MTQPNPNPSQGGSIWTGGAPPKPPVQVPGPYGAPGPQGHAGSTPGGGDWDDGGAWRYNGFNPDNPTGGGNFNPGIQIDTSMASSSIGSRPSPDDPFEGYGHPGDLPPGSTGVSQKPPAIDHHEEGYQMGRQIGQSLMGELQGMFSQLERWFS
jgi:hypothetical protein